jgi:hypothetical protein
MRRARIARRDVQGALSTFFFQLGLLGEIGGRPHPRFRHFHTTKTLSGRASLSSGDSNSEAKADGPCDSGAPPREN